MSNTQNYEAMEADYGVDTFRRSAPMKTSKQQRPAHSRRGKAPQSLIGIHRRRRRNISW
jgi:hypothetical protein